MNARIWITGTIIVTSVGLCQAQTDKIKPKVGRDIRCTVRATTPAAIQYEVNGQPQEISVSDVEHIEFGGEPLELGRARTRLENGQYMDCLTELQKINPDQLAELVRAEFEYLRAMAETRRATVEGAVTLRDAAQTVSRFLQAYPNSFRFYTMTEEFAWLAFHSGELASAANSFRTLAASGVTRYALSGNLGAAQVALEQHNPDEAKLAVQAIAAIDSNDDFAQEAKLIAVCLDARIQASQQQYDQALTQLEQIIKNESPERKRVFSFCYNSMGLCHLGRGELKTAAMDFLHTDLLFASEGDLHAEALYHLSNIWTQLNEVDRALKSKQTLSQQYRNTYWAGKTQ